MNTIMPLFNNEFASVPAKNDEIGMQDAATVLNVSVATIRNWIKEGLLYTTRRGYVSCNSLEAFRKGQIGKTRLVKRANKTKKTASNYEEASQLVRQEVKKDIFPDNFFSIYEKTLGESYRNKEGIYYTPQDIVKDMLRMIEGKDLSEATFLDPCCGSGNFIMQALHLGFKPQNVYGYDTDVNAVAITKRRIKDATGAEAEGIVCADFLTQAKSIKRQFDFIYTNPPWGKKLDKNEKEHFAKMFQTGGSTDTASLFFFACLSVLREKGHLGFLFPESVLNIGNFESTRIAILQESVARIVDYGKPFKGVLTKAYGIILKKEDASDSHYVECKSEDDTYMRKQQTFSNMPKHILNIWARQEDILVIEKLYASNHILLTHDVAWGLGVVTGNNQKLCKTEIAPSYIPIYRGQDIFPNKLAHPHYYINKTLEGCQQIAPMSLYLSKEKLIYRFISNKLVFYNDQSQAFILNSANMLVPQEKFPITGKALAQMLNSDIMNWIFAKIFNTHKILRSDLETLPIFLHYVSGERFDEHQLLLDLNIKKENGTFRIKE